MGLPLLPTPSTSTSSPPSRTPVSCSGQATPVYCGGLYPSDTCSRAQAVMLGRGASAGDPQPEDSPRCGLAHQKQPLGFPGGAVVEGLPANAGDTGSSPGLGGSHMPRSNWAREPQLPSLRVWSLCSATGGAAIVRGPRTAMKSGPHLPQLEKALAQKRRPNTAKNK